MKSGAKRDPVPLPRSQRPAECDHHRVRLKTTPLDATAPDTARALIDESAMLLPHIRITDLLLEVDAWTDFTVTSRI